MQVGDYDPRDPLLDEVWGALADAQVPVVVHCGSGPAPGRFTGPGPFGEVLARHPRLPAVSPTWGCPSTPSSWTSRAATTTSGSTPRWRSPTSSPTGMPFAPALLPELRALGLDRKVLLGTDFPNIPYPYSHQLEALARLGLGEDWLRQVLWHAGADLFGVSWNSRAGGSRWASSIATTTPQHRRNTCTTPRG